jgi:hypothetical protein
VTLRVVVDVPVATVTVPVLPVISLAMTDAPAVG